MKKKKISIMLKRHKVVMKYASHSNVYNCPKNCLKIYEIKTINIF